MKDYLCVFFVSYPTCHRDLTEMGTKGEFETYKKRKGKSEREYEADFREMIVEIYKNLAQGFL